MSASSAIPQGSTVLVTAVNGFIGSHVADQLLLAGYKVRGTTRDTSKAKWAQKFFDKRYGAGKFETVVVPNMNVEGAYDEATKGVSAVAHVAANLSMSTDPNIVIPETVNGALNALRAARKSPTVKRVVVTSSSAASISAKLDIPFTITPSTYNDEAVKLAWEQAATKSGTQDLEYGIVVYTASKTEAERACWKFVESEKPGFELSTVLPSMTFGPVLDKTVPASTGEWVGKILKGEGAPFAAVIPTGYFVDVRDVARLHVAALTNPTVKSERIFAFGESFNWTQVFTILRKAYPDHAGNIPGDVPNEPKNLSIVETKARSEELLRSLGQDGFVGLEESLRANAEAYL